VAGFFGIPVKTVIDVADALSAVFSEKRRSCDVRPRPALRIRQCRPADRKFTLPEAERVLRRIDPGSRIDPAALLRGMNVELEHHDLTCGDPEDTGRIALSHLRERPDYYDRLEKYVEGDG